MSIGEDSQGKLIGDNTYWGYLEMSLAKIKLTWVVAICFVGEVCKLDE